MLCELWLERTVQAFAKSISAEPVHNRVRRRRQERGVLGAGVLVLVTDQPGAERGLDRTGEPHSLTALEPGSRNTRGRHLGGEQQSFRAGKREAEGRCASV